MVVGRLLSYWEGNFSGAMFAEWLRKIMTEQVFSSIWPNISTNMDFPEISGFPSPTRGPRPFFFFGSYKFDQLYLRGCQSNPKSWWSISLIRRLLPPTKKVTLLLMVQKSGKLTCWGEGWFIPSFTKKYQHHPTSAWPWDFWTNHQNRTNKNGNSKKNGERWISGKFPPTSMMRWNSFNSFSFSCSLIIKSSGTTWSFPENLSVCYYPVFSITSLKRAPLPKKQQDNNRGGGYFTWNWFLSIFHRFYR